jgi:hypothetical protein
MDLVAGCWWEGLFAPGISVALSGRLRCGLIPVASTTKIQELRHQELSGHKDFETMMGYTQVLNRLQKAVASENDRIIRADRSASLLSGYKGNRINWLPASSKSDSVSDA